jgi:hypothetical protein
MNEDKHACRAADQLAGMEEGAPARVGRQLDSIRAAANRAHGNGKCDFFQVLNSKEHNRYFEAQHFVKAQARSSARIISSQQSRILG